MQDKNKKIPAIDTILIVSSTRLSLGEKKST